ncbi:hypothetical protein Tco_1036623 [Tanacetum coccineum]
MGDENPIRTLGDYSKPSHEGYRNTIELPIGNNVDLTLYDNESWNDPRDFAKPIKEIALPQDVLDARLSKFEADFKQQQSKITNKIDTGLKAITDRMHTT